MQIKHIVLSVLFLFFFSSWDSREKLVMNIAGEWTVQLDSTDIGLKNGWQNSSFKQLMKLPGTTDDAGLGVPNKLKPGLEKPQMSHLTRKNSYLGAAWYTREITIPKNWKGKEFILKLERVIWKTNVWIDGKELSFEQNSVVAPHYFDLTQYLTPGKTHRLTIRVDNRKQFEISDDNMAHSYTNHTQIIWNGIIGKMEIEASDAVRITNLQIKPDISSGSAKVSLTFNNKTNKSAKGILSISAVNKKSKISVETLQKEIQIKAGESVVEVDYNMGKDVKLWSEFSPELYELKAELKAGKKESNAAVDFGMRSFSRKGSVLTINNQPVFLRGTLECNIFPLTGHPPMDKEGWRKVFGTAKDWGLNHLRFHSWCPPQAAFEVADEMGFYLQVELPVWALEIGKDQKTTDFLYAEAQRMINEYGNHPSFCMWSMGNELQGDMTVLTKLMNSLKAKDDRHLYTTTSFTFEKGHGDWPEPKDDFFITQWTKKGWVRGQGVFNSESPTFNKDYVTSVEGMTVPVVTHEIGQYAVYPKLDEISKYTGVLEPINFKSVKEDLERKGLINKAADYTNASGKLAVILYKEEIERALKTAGISGFQLLDLHDFPGQGTALVGLLDAFWDSKGLISAEEFREFSAPVVPLLRFAKATYTNNETFTASLDVTNYSAAALKDQEIVWSINDGNAVLDSGSTKAGISVGYNHKVLDLNESLQKITKATKLTIKVSLKGTNYKNQWNIWVYPQKQTIDYGQVVYTRSLEEAYKLLNAGKKVLLNPDWKKIKGIEGKFVPVFWSPVHFPKQAGTMGVLCNPSHKALADFPTDMNTDWQWWDLNVNSTTLITDKIEGGNPIVEMVDNFANNRKLASLYEGSVKSGKLVIASFDLTTDLEKRPVAKQMLISVLKYMNSSSFNPEAIKNPDVLKSILADQKEKGKEDAKSIY
ncbi:glycosyl hydrolase family 2 [Flavobacterium cutihirudinis]|uniref:Glycosyl hydrolase family 2 n=1 Tax=Flavobacterium cutihirudinis TaxID=1265740 RepID=A0A3D9FPV5_9FLAO|nr:sugar-binding domain-containing protein [Flavobacterium cutihirudinis]RED22518.1 glycosyl hydrolase family 2 [Flavobacterium cutihirudinis]